MERGGIVPWCGSGSRKEAEDCQLVTALYKSWYIPLLRYASHKIRDCSVAEDIVHDAFMALYSDLRNGAVVERPRAWLFVTVRRRIADYYRRTGREKNWDGHLEEIAAPEPAPAMGTSGLGGMLRILSAREQEVLLLRVSSMKYREIADELGISANSVCQLLARAVRKLRKAVAESQGGDIAQRKW